MEIHLNALLLKAEGYSRTGARAGSWDCLTWPLTWPS
jgi:hypothetical protein